MQSKTYWVLVGIIVLALPLYLMFKGSPEAGEIDLSKPFVAFTVAGAMLVAAFVADARTWLAALKRLLGLFAAIVFLRLMTAGGADDWPRILVDAFLITGLLPTFFLAIRLAIGMRSFLRRKLGLEGAPAS